MIFISIFFAEGKMIAVYKYTVFLFGIGLFWLIVSASYDKLKLIYCFLAGIFLQACLGSWQFLTQSSFACKWLGMAEHNAGDLGTSVIETISSTDGIGERWLRAYGGLDHPNVIGGLLVVGILLIIGLAIRHSDFNFRKLEIACPPGLGRRGNWKLGEDVKCDGSIAVKPCGDEAQAVNNDLQRGSTAISRLWSQQKSQISSIILLSIVCCFLSALFFTFSRGAWIGLAIGILIMLIAMVIKKDLRGQKKLLEIILISSALIFILFSQFQDLVLTRLSNDARLEVKSNFERIESYKDSWGMIKDNWLFGVGVGNYVSEIKTQGAKLPVGNLAPYIQPVHNVFLLVWAEIGIIGLLFFISLLLCVTRYVLCDKTNAESKNLNIKISILTAMTIMFLVDHWWWSLHFGVLLFWLVTGLMVRKFDSQERHRG